MKNTIEAIKNIRMGSSNRNEYLVLVGERVKLPQGWRRKDGSLVCYRPVFSGWKPLGSWPFDGPEAELPPFLLDTDGYASAAGVSSVPLRLLQQAVKAGEKELFITSHRPVFHDIVNQGPHNPDFEEDGGTTVVINRNSKYFAEAEHYLMSL